MGIMTNLKGKPTYKFDFGNGAIAAEFYVHATKHDVKHNYLRIYAPNGVFDLKVVGYSYVYLLQAAIKGDTNEIQAFVMLMWRCSQEVYQDAGLAQDLLKAFAKYDKRTAKKAAKKAASVSEEEEAANQALMADAAKWADATPKERKKMRKESRKQLREALDDMGDGEA